MGTGHLIFPLEGGCPLLGGDKLTIGNALVLCLRVVLFSTIRDSTVRYNYYTCVAVTGRKQTTVSGLIQLVIISIEITPDFLCPFMKLHDFVAIANKFQSHSYWQSLVIAV